MGGGRAYAGDAPALDTSRCQPATAARLDWLASRLESRAGYAKLWWGGWLGIYSTGMVVKSVEAGLEGDRGERADDIVSAVKAVGGVVRLAIDRPTPVAGAEPLRHSQLIDERDCQERVASGEALLRRAAVESDRRWDWKAHAINVAVNVAGGVIVSQAFDNDDGWTSAAVGIGVGEAMLWSHPWNGGDDLTDYETRFGLRGPARISWSVLPFERGLRVQIGF